MKVNRRFLKPKKCSVTKKTIFRTEKDAGRGMMRIWSHDTTADIFDLHIYGCSHCGGWHVGHKSYYEKVRAKFDAETVQPS